MKQLIEHIQKSIWGPAYYESLLTQNLKFSLKYYVNACLLLAVFVTIVTSLSLVPKLDRVLREFPDAFTAYYPEELEVQFTNGHASTSVAQPYFLALPRVLKESFSSTSVVSSLVVVDTQSPVTQDKFLSYQSLFWISEKSLVYQEEVGMGMREALFTPDMTFTVNKQALRGLIAQAEPYFHFASPMLVMALFIALVIRFTANLAYLFLVAVFVFLMGLLLNRKWNYGTAYRIALHASTLPLLLEQVALVTSLPRIPFFFTALLLAVVYVNFRKNESVPRDVAPIQEHVS